MDDQDRALLLQMMERIDELTTQVVRLRAQVELAQVEVEWLTTGDAAQVLGVDRAMLDRLAPWAVQVVPAAVIQIGLGKRRASYKWARCQLGVAVQRAREVEAEARPTPRRGRR